MFLKRVYRRVVTRWHMGRLAGLVGVHAHVCRRRAHSSPRVSRCISVSWPAVGLPLTILAYIHTYFSAESEVCNEYVCNSGADAKAADEPEGSYVRIIVKKLCADSNSWEAWTAWSNCTKPCAGGKRVRRRKCLGGASKRMLLKHAVDEQECVRALALTSVRATISRVPVVMKCSSANPTTSTSRTRSGPSGRHGLRRIPPAPGWCIVCRCSQPCGGGVKRRVRTCQSRFEVCQGDDAEALLCSDPAAGECGDNSSQGMLSFCIHAHPNFLQHSHCGVSSFRLCPSKIP
jgi:hypothetical protein